MHILYFFIFLALILLIFWAVHKVIVHLCYDINVRFLCCRYLAAIVLEMAAINFFTFPWLLTKINALITRPEIQNIWSTILPQRNFNVLFMLLVFISMNLFVLLATTAVLGLTRAIFCRNRSFINLEDKGIFFKLIHFPWLLANRFYVEEDGEYHLSEQGVTLGLWAKGIKGVFLFIWITQIVLVSLSLLWGGKEWNEHLYLVTKAWYQVPFMIFLLAEQAQFFLEADELGVTGTYRSEKIKGEWRGDLDALMKAYASTFKDSGILLHSHLERAAKSGREAQGNQLGTQQRLDCIQGDVLEILSNQLRNSGTVQNDNYQNALIAMLNGNSVHICDYSRGEFLAYLSVYLNYHFSLGKTALFVCDTEEQAESFSEALTAQLNRLNTIGTVWNISCEKKADAEKPIHALIVSGTGMADNHLLDKYPAFTKRIFLTVFEDGDVVFSKGSVEIARIFHEISCAVRNQTPPQYLVFSPADNTDLRTAMEQHIGVEIRPFQNDSLTEPAENGIMVWKEEGIYKPQSKLGIGDSRSNYMGTAIPLALIALKYDMPRVYLLPDDARADDKYDEIMHGFTNDVQRYLGKAINLKSAIRYSPEETTGERDLKTIILYDNTFNLPDVLRAWRKYSGKNGGMFHIISPSYMLRDFFASSLDKLQQKSSALNEMIPYYMGMKRSHMATLLVSLSKEGISERKLMEKNSELNWGYPDVVSLLRDCLGVILRDVELHNVYEYFQFHQETVFQAKEGRFEREIRVQLTDESVCNLLKDYFSRAMLVASEELQLELPMLWSEVYNYYLDDQIVAAGGQFYKIYSIQNGRVYGKQITPETLYQYYQVTDFKFENWKRIENCTEYSNMGMELGTAKSNRRIYGYWASNNGNSFVNEDNLVFYDCKQKNLDTTVDNAYVMRITIKNQASEKLPGMELILALMLNELFKTLFPRRYQNIFAVTSQTLDGELLEAVRRGYSTDIQRIQSIIPGMNEKKTKENAENQDGTVYVVEHSTMEYGMVQMLYQHREQVFSLIRDYLAWYLGYYQDSEEEGAVMENGYLHFGGDRLPEIFSVGELLELCRVVTPEHESIGKPETENDDNVTPGRFCTFCGRPVVFFKDLLDGRCMCPMCAEHQVQEREEIRALFQSERKIMEDGFHLEGQFPDKIHIQFRSASSIRKRTGNVGGGRVLGFYEPDTRQLWIENGGPWTSMRATVFHELTHAWQYENLDIPEMTKRLPVEKKDQERLMKCILEGYAVYVELESMERINEKAYSTDYYKYIIQQNDVYGIGLRMVEEYTNDRKSEGSHITPFVVMKDLEAQILSGNYPLPIISFDA